MISAMSHNNKCDWMTTTTTTIAPQQEQYSFCEQLAVLLLTAENVLFRRQSRQSTNLFVTSLFDQSWEDVEGKRIADAWCDTRLSGGAIANQLNYVASMFWKRQRHPRAFTSHKRASWPADWQFCCDSHYSLLFLSTDSFGVEVTAGDNHHNRRTTFDAEGQHPTNRLNDNDPASFHR